MRSNNDASTAHNDVVHNILGKVQKFPSDLNIFSHNMPNATSLARELVRTSASADSTSVTPIVDRFSILKDIPYSSKVDFSKFDLSPLSMKVEQLFTQYFVAIVVGASVGAAVTAGIFGGCLVSSSCIRWLQYSNNNFLSFWERLIGKGYQRNQYGDENADVDSFTTTNVSVLNIESNVNQMLVLKSEVKAKAIASNGECLSHEDEYKACIQKLEKMMKSLNITWNNVQKMTVFLLTERHASEFYSHLESIIPDFPKEQIVMTTLFVSRIASGSSIQIEVLAGVNTDN